MNDFLLGEWLNIYPFKGTKINPLTFLKISLSLRMLRLDTAAVSHPSKISKSEEKVAINHEMYRVIE